MELNDLTHNFYIQFFLEDKNASNYFLEWVSYYVLYRISICDTILFYK